MGTSFAFTHALKHRFVNDCNTNAGQNTHLPLYFVVLNGELTNYEVRKSSSDNFLKFPGTICKDSI